MFAFFKYFVSLTLVSVFSFSGFATHNRAGEITYEHISGNTYKITLITYTYTPSAANESRNQLTIQWGDDTQSDIPRTSIVYLPDDIQKNTYVGNHTFPGAGVYVIIMSDPNRNANIVNIPESVTVVFSIKTILKIDPLIGSNNTPIMLNPPVDKAALNQPFIHNPNAYDPDGDSLSYKLSICLGNDGLPIPNYSYPAASVSLSVDPISGDFIWNSPVTLGEYNVAIEIEEWRNGIKIGSIIRDMQIEVEETDNTAPNIQAIQNYCVTAGSTINFTVTATDSENDNISLSATGGPFEFTVNPAVFRDTTGASPISQTFNWNTECIHIRKQAYSVLFRAVDQNPEVSLTDYESADIEVIAPAPENLTSSPTGYSVLLSWDLYSCSNASGFKIYRKQGSYPYTPANCETGAPNGIYRLVSVIEGADLTGFEDTDGGIGLPQGFSYCYRITAFFEDGAESYISAETCCELTRSAPVMTETSVKHTDETNGSIHLTWMQVQDFDAVNYPGPYKYTIESVSGTQWENFSNPVDIFGITDTTYTDTLINTKDNGKSYKINFFSQNGANWEQVGVPSYSSSVFLTGIPGDRRMTILMSENTPWNNKQYVIYRKNSDADCLPNTSSFDSITTVTSNFYTDYGLINGNNYWYLVKTIGEYDLNYIPKPIINYSQEICVSPQDITPPCAVNLALESDCDLFKNYLTWSVNESCAEDIDNFLIFYSNSLEGPFQLIDTVFDNTQRNYVHSPEVSLGACYVVSAQDSAGNYIKPENLIRSCIDDCSYYELPNVFTPNADGLNDLFIPYPYKFVEKIDMTIYNRWGSPVFTTNNPDINWNGIDSETNRPVSDGVYYYICDVYEKRLSGIVVRNLSGTIRIFANSGNKRQN